MAATRKAATPAAPSPPRRGGRLGAGDALQHDGGAVLRMQRAVPAGAAVAVGHLAQAVMRVK